MTALKLALLKLNLNRHQVAFWEAKIQHAIRLAATTEQFDRHSLAAEKNLVSVELTKLELLLKNKSMSQLFQTNGRRLHHKQEFL